MGFKIVDVENTKMYSGQIIKYNVTPLFGINMRWVTEISHVKKNSFFVDEQRFGPYKFWHHKHMFDVIDGGVKTTDLLDYSLPMGPIGRLLQPILIKPKIEEIFEYRRKKLIEIFGEI